MKYAATLTVVPTLKVLHCNTFTFTALYPKLRYCETRFGNTECNPILIWNYKRILNQQMRLEMIWNSN